MIVLLSRRAEEQLRALPAPAAKKVVRALRVLAAVPHSGRRESDVSHYRGLMSKVVRIRRDWSYRVIYEIRERWIMVHHIAPSWSDPS